MTENVSTFQDDTDRLLHPPTVHSESWMDPAHEEELASVILPAYNRAHFLPDAIGSVIDQTYRPVELLVVDDGSTDNTREVVEVLSERPDSGLRIRFFHQRNQGAPAARNLGLLKSQGEFVHFLDSDDILHPQALAFQVYILRENPELDFTSGPVDFFDDGFMPKLNDRVQPNWRSSIAESPGTASQPVSALYRRKACQHIGPWHESLERMQDWEYAFRIAALRLKGASLEQPYYYARSHSHGSIGDLLDRPEGVLVDLRSLSAIEHVVAVAEAPTEDMVYTIFRLYLKLLRRAIRYGTEDNIESCLNGLERHSVKNIRKAKVRVMRFLYQTFGANSIQKVIDLYSRIQKQ